MIPALLLVVLAAAYRVVTGIFIQSGATWLSNFAPFAAIALCSAAYFPRYYKFSIPLLALFASDLILNFHYSASLLDPLIFCRYGAFLLVGLLGLVLQNRASLKTLLPASIGASTIFYLITNAFSWFADPGYVKNFGGLIQALTVGLSQYGTTPTWMFFRNSILSDLLFTAVFVLCMSFGRSAAASRVGAPIPRST